MRTSSAIRFVLLCAGLTACQGGPAAPAGAPPDVTGVLPAGRYLLAVGMAGEQDRSCVGRMEPWGLFGPTIGASIVISAEGDAWVGRLEPPAQDALELRLRRASSNGSITGTVRGPVPHFVDRFGSAPPRTVSFAASDPNGSASFEATLLERGAVVGIATGAITFTHTSGTTLTCPSVSLTLGRQP